MAVAATAETRGSHRRHEKPTSVAGRCAVDTAKIAAMMPSEVKQYGQVAPSSVTDTVVR
jgi:hypothetical protein